MYYLNNDIMRDVVLDKIMQPTSITIVMSVTTVMTWAVQNDKKHAYEFHDAYSLRSD
ncbi:MAG TPA: hypothetical protein VH500_13150 [Nitrososphaeraceae archaeon]